MHIPFTDIQSDHTRDPIRSKIVIYCLAALLVSTVAPAVAQQTVPMAIPSDFVRMLSIPGSMDQFLRPAKVFYDRAADELYVADQGNNRIVIFNRQGTYRFEFAMAGHVGSITDFAVSTEGYIYVLGSSREGRKLLRFDFDGLFLGELLSGPDGTAGMDVTSLTIGQDQNLYLLDQSVPQLVRVTPEGAVVRRMPILNDLDAKTRREMVYGKLSATPKGLLLPLSMLGTVYLFDYNGAHTSSYGYLGSTTGELTFPVSAAMNGDGMVLVLDKQRYNVLCFATTGKFVGEFGGKGISPGWFYLPSYLATDATDQVYISQVFLNRVQICRIPDSIQRRFEQAQAKDGSPSLGMATPDLSDNNRNASNPNYQSTQGGSQ